MNNYQEIIQKQLVIYNLPSNDSLLNNLKENNIDGNSIDFVTSASAPLKVQADDKFGYYNVLYKDTDNTLNLSDIFQPNNKYIFTFIRTTQSAQPQSGSTQPSQPTQQTQQTYQSQSEDDTALYAGGGLVIVCSIICCICIIIGVVLFFMYNKKNPIRKGGYFRYSDIV